MSRREAAYNELAKIIPGVTGALIGEEKQIKKVNGQTERYIELITARAKAQLVSKEIQDSQNTCFSYCHEILSDDLLNSPLILYIRIPTLRNFQTDQHFRYSLKTADTMA